MSITFKEAYELPIGQHVEKKGKFSYLSWCHSVKYLRENFPEATWTIHENPETYAPLFHTVKGFMVKVSVELKGQSFTQWHPVLNYQNKPIEEPNSFDVNTAIQRCLTKAIALATGLGLGLYAGEDLPSDDAKEEKKAQLADPSEVVAKFIKMADDCKTKDELKKLYIENVDDIEALPELQKAKILSYFGQIKETLKK